MMKTMFFAALVILTITFVNGQVNPTCDASTGISTEDCAKYIAEGAITVTFDGRTTLLTEEEEEQFKIVIANVSNDYVILTVTPEDVIIVQRVVNTNTRDIGLMFFILNPSGSTYMPVALRKQELYLMVKLNNDFINTYLGMDVTAVAPASSYPLAIPAWAIAIIGYVGLVIFIYCIMVLTRDWRKKMSDDFERKLEKEYHANSSNVANGVSVGEEIPMKNMPQNGNDYVEVDLESKRNGGPGATHKNVGVQTPRHVAVQVDPSEMEPSKPSPAPSQTSTTEAVIENGHSQLDDDEPAYDTADAAQPTTNDDVNKEADDAAAAIEGAVNEAFEVDETDAATLPSTNL